MKHQIFNSTFFLAVLLITPMSLQIWEDIDLQQEKEDLDVIKLKR